MILEHTATRRGKLLSFLRRELSLSEMLVKRLKVQDAYAVNGVSAYTDRQISPGDYITVRIEECSKGFLPEALPLDILFEDDALLAVDKPVGMMVHPTFYRNEGTLANRVLAYYERTEQCCAIHPANRLDRDTRGVVLFAKNAHIHAKCNAIMQAGAIRKTYLAAVCGHPACDRGVCTAPIAKVGGGSLLREIRPDGQAAVTEYESLEKTGAASLLLLHPLTGRTHQLRLHCLFMGAPILGDRQYFTAASSVLSARLGLFVQQLAAVKLEFCHPLTGEALSIRSRQTISLPEA